VTTGELLRLLEANGWHVVRQRGSHAICRHRERAGQLTVPTHRGKRLTGTVSAILKAAGLD